MVICFAYFAIGFVFPPCLNDEPEHLALCSWVVVHVAAPHVITGVTADLNKRVFDEEEVTLTSALPDVLQMVTKHNPSDALSQMFLQLPFSLTFNPWLEGTIVFALWIFNPPPRYFS